MKKVNFAMLLFASFITLLSACTVSIFEDEVSNKECDTSSEILTRSTGNSTIVGWKGIFSYYKPGGGSASISDFMPSLIGNGWTAGGAPTSSTRASASVSGLTDQDAAQDAIWQYLLTVMTRTGIMFEAVGPLTPLYGPGGNGGNGGNNDARTFAINDYPNGMPVFAPCMSVISIIGTANMLIDDMVSIITDDELLGDYYQNFIIPSDYILAMGLDPTLDFVYIGHVESFANRYFETIPFSSLSGVDDAYKYKNAIDNGFFVLTNIKSEPQWDHYHCVLVIGYQDAGSKLWCLCPITGSLRQVALDGLYQGDYKVVLTGNKI